MKLKHFIFFLFSFLLISCTQTMTNNTIDTDYGEKENNENKEEFDLAYSILDNFYLFAHSDSLVPKGTFWYRQLQSKETYIGKGYLNMKSDIDFPPEIMDTYYMFYTMNDQYTLYIPPQKFEFESFMYEFEKRDSICNTGLNVYPVTTGDSTALVVMQVYKESAADLLGMQIGDTIISIAGVKTNNKTIFDKLSSGTKKSIVEITIARNESGTRITKDYTVPLISYITPSVTYMVLDSIAIIKISEFSNGNTPSKRGTYGEFLEALEKTSYTKATIIDLRGNLGGDVNQCDSITQTMLHKNDTIGFMLQANIDTTTNKNVIQNHLHYVQSDGIASNRYIVFLADTNSASCSEYTIMGVTNTKKSPIVGMNTLGKGIAYIILPSYLKGTMLVTNSMVVDKNKVSYHMRGIKPDIALNNNDKMLDTALAIAKKGSLKRTQSYGDDIRKIFMRTLTKESQTYSLPTKDNLGMYKVHRNPLSE